MIGETKAKEEEVEMDICDDDHEVVCYEAGDCPVCDEMGLREDLVAENRDLASQVDELELTVRDMKNEIASLRAGGTGDLAKGEE